MPYFEISNVFHAKPDTGEVGLRVGTDIQPVDLEQPAEAYRTLFHATGLHRYDFAVFGATLSEDGIDEHGLVVLTEQRGTGLLADADYLEAHPEYLTAELANKLASVDRLYLEEFTIEPILIALAKRFPNARGFSK